jgi:hypothetical protein
MRSEAAPTLGSLPPNRFRRVLFWSQTSILLRIPARVRPASASSRRRWKRVAEREPHLTAAQVRDEIAAGRMIIPANIHHLKPRTSTRCASGARARPRSTRTWARAPSSGTDEEVEKLKWAERWGGDTVMDLSTGGDLDATGRRSSKTHRPDRHRPDLLDDHRAQDRGPRRAAILETVEHQASRASTT